MFNTSRKSQTCAQQKFRGTKATQISIDHNKVSFIKRHVQTLKSEAMETVTIASVLVVNELYNPCN